MARILVADDEPDILRVVSLQLELEGHVVVPVRSAREALDRVDADGPPDVVVLDVAMPQMNGLDLLRELRRRDGMEDVPAIFLSARALRHDIAAGEALGAVYVTKPFAARELEEAIDRVLATGPRREAR